MSGVGALLLVCLILLVVALFCGLMPLVFKLKESTLQIVGWDS